MLVSTTITLNFHFPGRYEHRFPTGRFTGVAAELSGTGAAAREAKHPETVSAGSMR